MKRIAVAVPALLLVMLGCVIIPSEHTINAHIVVDVNIVQEHISDINDYISGEIDVFPELEVSEETQVEGTEDSGPESWMRRTRDFLTPIQVAHAQQKVSPEIKAAAERRRKRLPALQTLKNAKCVGENNRAYVELRPSAEFENAEAKNDAQRLVAEENQDRKVMYKELAQLNKKSVSTIEELSAADLLKRAESGQIVQLPPKGKAFDEFKASAKGQQLGADCVPGRWVEIK